MKNLLYFLIAGFIFVSSCKYDHEITDPCELHPNDKLSEILIGVWGPESGTTNPDVINEPLSNITWEYAVDDLNLSLQPGGHFEWGNFNNGTWRIDDDTQSLKLDYSQANHSDSTIKILRFDRCFFVIESYGIYVLYRKL